MTVDELVAKLLKCRSGAEVKVRVGEEMGPAHFTEGVVMNGLDEPIIVCTHRVDDPEDRGSFMLDELEVDSPIE